MRILTVSDVESKALWDYFHQNSEEHYDLIISAGDLEADYLSFLTTMFQCDVLYVPGNHDRDYKEHPPEGCMNIDGKVINYKGIRIAGLGGSYRYNSHVYQYTEGQMRRRIWKMYPKIFLQKGVDILVTHAPARGIHDGDDLPHRGFQCFNTFLDKFKPNYYIHGHVHMSYGREYPRVDRHGQTTIINAYERYAFEIHHFNEKEKNQ